MLIPRFDSSKSRYRTFVLGMLMGTILSSAASLAIESPSRLDAAASLQEESLIPAKDPRAIRVATMNVSLYGTRAGELAERLEGGKDVQARQTASIIQTVQPDILLLNEIDYSPDHRALRIFIDQYLGIPQRLPDGKELVAIGWEHFYAGAVNTGVDSGLDLNRDGQLHTADDAWGFGRYSGQYAMALLSRYPIDQEQIRTFQKLRWQAMPGALVPIDPKTKASYYPEDVWRELRLSSKSHWDVPVRIGDQTLHLLASHPTPPAFDGPERRNRCRNHDEIQFWSHYIEGNPASVDWIVDDAGNRGPLSSEASFVILGDLNSDPEDGGGIATAIQGLLRLQRVTDPRPSSRGGVAAATSIGQANTAHRGDPALDTSQFSPKSVGNLRVDYTLPSSDIEVLSSGVFWPLPKQSEARWIEASDHRLVWVDCRIESARANAD